MEARLGAALALGMCVISAAVVKAPPASSENWKMPDVVGMTLEGAYGQIGNVTHGALTAKDFLKKPVYGIPRTEVINSSFWRICWQYPQSGSSLTHGVKIYVGIARPTDFIPGRSDHCPDQD